MVQAPLHTPPTRVAPLPRPLGFAWLISVLLLAVVGGTLLFFPATAQFLWPWKLAPFNARMLGAIYASAALPLVGYLLTPQLSYLRVVLPIFTCFTTYLFVVSIFHLDVFQPRKVSVIWLVLYGVDSLVGLYYCWRWRQRLFGARSTLYWATLYRVQSLALCFYGFGLLFLPKIFGNWWAWPLNQFHSYLYSGVFLTAALATELLRDRGTARERWWFGLTQLCLGVSTFLGTLAVDAEVQRLDWTFLSTWLWQIAFLAFSLVGGLIFLEETLGQQNSGLSRER